MAAFSTLVAIGSLAMGINSIVQGQAARKDAQDAQNQSIVAQQNAQREQEKIQGEQKAQNAAQAAAERRSQIREERVRRGRILQGAENTGTEFSSSEYGALGSLSTGLATNIGSNLGKISAADRISQYAQNAANFGGDARDANVRASNFMMDASAADSMFKMSTSIFSAAGGFGTINKAFTPTPDPIGDFYQRGTRGAGD